jgi:hypothetical protein
MAEQDSLSEPTAFDRLYQEQGSPIRKFLRLSVGNSRSARSVTFSLIPLAQFNLLAGGIWEGDYRLHKV